jgi:hypothetical protein
VLVTGLALGLAGLVFADTGGVWGHGEGRPISTKQAARPFRVSSLLILPELSPIDRFMVAGWGIDSVDGSPCGSLWVYPSVEAARRGLRSQAFVPPGTYRIANVVLDDDAFLCELRNHRAVVLRLFRRLGLTVRVR